MRIAHNPETVSIAETIFNENDYFSAFKLAEEQGGADQQWEKETTVFTFKDNSYLVFCDNSFNVGA